MTTIIYYICQAHYILLDLAIYCMFMYKYLLCTVAIQPCFVNIAVDDYISVW